MKSIIEFPEGIFHINQARLKRVRMHEDVVERFSTDPRWKHQDQIGRMSAAVLLAKIAGMSASVLMAWRGPEGALMYGILLDEAVEAPNNAGVTMVHNKCQFPADYFSVLDHGHMEAR